MGCDMVVALGPATRDGRTLFAQSVARPQAEGRCLRHVLGREFAPGEKVYTQFLELSQVRQTCTVLAWRPDSWWGYGHGVNEHGVVAGCAELRTRLTQTERGLSGGDLVRVALERSDSARHAVDLITGLVERHGECDSAETTGQGVLVADGAEAFALEIGGRHWVCQEIHELRAASNVCLIRQDWDRVSTGLASHAITQGWWPDDGTKLDFAGTLAECPTGHDSGLRRWGRATLLLEQQSGGITLAFLRRLLADHYEGTHFEITPREPEPGPTPLCQHGHGPSAVGTTAASIVTLGTNPYQPPVLWHAFGPPCEHLFFPLFLGADLPIVYSAGNHEAADCGFWSAQSALERHKAVAPADGERWIDLRDGLQNRFDQDAAEFMADSTMLRQQGNPIEWQRLAAALMQRHAELFETTIDRLVGKAPPVPAIDRSEVAAYY